jgi:small subunit ribosomal protein S6
MDTHKAYESTVIINASLDDPQVEAIINRISDMITKNGGSISALNKWGRKRLAYPINKKTNGYYVNYEFTAPPSLIVTLERSYQLDEMILRYLTIVLDAKAIAAKAAAAAALQAEETPAAVPAREPLFKESDDAVKP